MGTVVLVLLATLALFLVKRFFEYRAAVRSVQYVLLAGNLPIIFILTASSNHPGSRTLVTAFSLFGYTFQNGIPGRICEGVLRSWHTKYGDFEYYGVDIISAVRLCTSPLN